jgi:hypothetical protein
MDAVQKLARHKLVHPVIVHTAYADTQTRGHALWGQPVSTGGASGWRRCRM